MKQLLIVILAICVILLMGCQSESYQTEPTETDPSVMDATWQDINNTHQTESTGETTPATEGRSDTQTPTQTVSPETNQTPTEGTTKKDNEGSATTVTEPKETAPPPTEETKPKEEVKQPPTEATNPPTDPTEESKPPATDPAEPEEPKAAAADAGAIASKVAELLNAYRAEQGSPAVTVLPGLTQYAEYRSRQLVTNFAHDTHDERAAATALQYGSYIDPALYGMTGEPYYTANAREAIAKTDFGGTIDAVAARLARLARNSSSHWSYVGGAEYTYIGVGITYQSGIWYCDIAVTSSNTDAS